MSPRACLICLLLFIPGVSSAQEPLVIEPATASGAEAWPSHVLERHAIRVDVQGMRALDQWTANPGTGQRLVFTAREVDGEADSFSWRGRIRSEDGYGGTATFTVHNERVRGRLSLGQDRYQIVTDRSGQVWLDQMDMSQRPPTHPPGGVKIPPEAEDPQSSDSPRTAHSGMTAASHQEDDDGEPPVVDVLVFYTPAAAEADNYEDEADLRLAIQNAVDSANTGFLNSEVEGRVRLLGIKRWDYDESQSSGMEEGLDDFTHSSEIQQLAERHSADLSALVADYGDFCGLAWLLEDYTDDWTHLSYSVTSVIPQCLGGQTLAHELGHNMGLNHEPEDDGGTSDDPIEPFAFGHFQDEEFRTIMATVDGCDNGGSVLGSSCPLIDHFSNPEVDDPDSEHPTGVEGERNNAETLRRSMDHVQRWREQPASLSEALGNSGREFTTTGDSVWVVQDEFLHDDAPTALSGPVFDGEHSRLRLDTSADDGLEVTFVARSLSGEPESRLVLRGNGETLKAIDSLDTEWREFTVEVPDDAERLEWVWQTDSGVSLASAGQALVAMSSTETGEFGDSDDGGSASSSSSSSSSSSGCSFGSSSSSAPDPTLSLLILGAAAGLGRRRRRGQVMTGTPRGLPIN